MVAPFSFRGPALELREALRETLDDAEASLAHGEGTEITRESMRELTDGIMERTGARIAAEQKAAR